jgi:hypothetical protein
MRKCYLRETGVSATPSWFSMRCDPRRGVLAGRSDATLLLVATRDDRAQCVAATGIEFDVEPAITTRYVTIGSTGVRVNEPAPLVTVTVLADVIHTPSGRAYCNDATPLMEEETATV